MNQAVLMEMLKEARNKKTEVGAEYDKITTLVKSLIDQCEHDWNANGHTSHEDCYKCAQCGITKFE